jgi:hypothetical protein
MSRSVLRDELERESPLPARGVRPAAVFERLPGWIGKPMRHARATSRATVGLAVSSMTPRTTSGVRLDPPDSAEQHVESLSSVYTSLSRPLDIDGAAGVDL